jgi:hypothetical protein
MTVVRVLLAVWQDGYPHSCVGWGKEGGGKFKTLLQAGDWAFCRNNFSDKTKLAAPVNYRAVAIGAAASGVRDRELSRKREAARQN